MVAYTGIQGQNILIVSSDPANPTEGQIWYNSTSNLLKGYQFATVNAFASGGNLNTARGGGGVSGTDTAGLYFGGPANAPLGNTGVTELYNGTSWTTSPATMNLVTYWRSSTPAGTQTASLAAGGLSATVFQNETESWNGSTWTNLPATLNTARYAAGSSGTQTAALTFSGYAAGFSLISSTESWNGSSWTTLPASVNNGRAYLAGCGTQTAALAFGGGTPPAQNASESYNGTSWTNTPSLNTGRYSLAGFGTQTAAVAAGGNGYITNTELWNGSTWTNNPTGLATGRFRAGGLGSQTNGLVIGGKGPPTAYIVNTEEWTGQAVQVRTITTS